MSAPPNMRAPGSPPVSRLGFLVLGIVAYVVSQRGLAYVRPAVFKRGSSRRPADARGRALRREAGVQDAVNNVSPEMSAAGKKYAQRYEDLFLGGQRLWSQLKKMDGGPPKIYFIGTNGNMAEEVSQAFLEALAYIPCPDGTYYIHRKPDGDNPPIVFSYYLTDKKLGELSKIAPVDLFMDDEDEYRRLETEALKDFDAQPVGQHPMGCIVGESALSVPENAEIVKRGLVVWLDADPAFTWAKTQYRPMGGGGLYVSQEFQVRPPVWAVANGWDGDVDDAEGKVEYKKIVEEERKTYESLAQVRLRTDIPGLAENAHWGAERLVKAVNELYGFNAADDASLEGEVLERDLEKFLEGARLSKYLKPALAWCEEQGAASIEDIVENTEDFAEAISLKPLERKRLAKAAAAVAVA